MIIRKLDSRVKLVVVSSILILITMLLGLHFVKSNHSSDKTNVPYSIRGQPNLSPSPPLSEVTQQTVSPSAKPTKDDKSSPPHAEQTAKNDDSPAASKHSDQSQFNVQYTYAGRDDAPFNITRQYKDLLCNYNRTHSVSYNYKHPLLPANVAESLKCKKMKGSTPYVIGITPTYYRQTQRVDLTSLCQTLMNVPRFLWIVVEDSENTSQQVKEILNNCAVESVLLNIATSKKTKKAIQKGVEQRNLGLDWLRNHCKGCEERHGVCEGVVYFMDDDNVYSIRLFEHIRQTCNVSVFPVGLVGGLVVEGPMCKDGKVESWRVKFAPDRHVPVDMAAFAVNLKAIAAHPGVKMGYKTDQKSRSAHGYMESNFLQSLGVTRKSVECRGADHEVLVWHVKTTYTKTYEKKSSYPNFKV